MQLFSPGGLRLRDEPFPSAFVLTTVFNIILLLSSLSNASRTDKIAQEDRKHDLRVLDLHSRSHGSFIGGRESELGEYLPDFPGFDRSIIGRADGFTQLRNNVPGKSNIQTGETQFYTFSKVDLKRSEAGLPLSSSVERSTEKSPELDGSSEGWRAGPQRRQNTPDTLFVTLSMCDQPEPISPTAVGAPDPLQLYISVDAQNQKPDIHHNNFAVKMVYGLGNESFPISSDAFFAVTAPAKNSSFDGLYSYELTASTDKFYTSYNNNTGMTLVDSDTNSALLCAGPNATSASYGVFVHNQQDPAIEGLQNSFCGLQNHAQIQGNVNGTATGNVDTDMMALMGFPPLQHFYVNNTLNGSSAYYAIMATSGDAATGKAGSGIAGGGGTVSKAFNFSTKSSNNCAVIFNLTFCSDVAYAVPSNPKNDTIALMNLYDDNAKNLYQNFNYSLQQIPCNTTSSAQYSLVRNCTDCANAYKNWLCAVTIPRCEDFSNNAGYLATRAINSTFSNGTGLPASMMNVSDGHAMVRNQSRNPIIDQKIEPGPYKEVLPCVDLCYNLVQSCPASLQFACPLRGHGLEHSYGKNDSSDVNPHCNYPGAVIRTKVGAASDLQINIWFIASVVIISVCVGA